MIAIMHDSVAQHVRSPDSGGSDSTGDSSTSRLVATPGRTIRAARIPNSCARDDGRGQLGSTSRIGRKKMNPEPRDQKRLRKVFSTTDCPIQSVNVGLDRAEVTRNVSFSPTEGAGTYEIVLEDLGNAVEQDSLRVSGSGSGSCLIQDVSVTLARKPVLEGNQSALPKDELGKLLAKLEELRWQRISNEQEIVRLRRKKQMVDGYVRAMLTGSRKEEKDGVSPCACGPPAAEGGIEMVQELLTFDEEEAGKANMAISGAMREADTIKEQIEVLLQRLKGILPTHNFNSWWSAPKDTQDRVRSVINPPDIGVPALQGKRTYDATVVVSTEAQTEGNSEQQQFKLELTYMTRNARWQPSYDMRLEGSSSPSGGRAAKDAAVRKLHISYFGVVQQTTGEDWKNVSLSLSTTRPFIGVTPPPLKTLEVSYAPDPPATPQARGEKKALRRGGSKSAYVCEESAGPMMAMDECCEVMDGGDGFGANTVVATVAPAYAAGGGGGGGAGGSGLMSSSMTFSVPSLCDIGSDNAPHSVPVATLQLDCNVMHYCVPALSPSVFLQVRAINTSEYVLLPSSECRIYLGSAYVAKTQVSHVAPGDALHQFMGSDPSVTADFRPKKLDKRVGMLHKANVTVSEFTAVIDNSSNSTVQVAAVQQLPLSTDALIKVKTVSPTEGSWLPVGGLPDEAMGMAAFFGPPADAVQPQRGASNASDPGNAAAAAGGGGNGLSKKVQLVDGRNVLFNATSNNFLWLEQIEPHKKSLLSFAYSVEWPVGKEITFTSPSSSSMQQRH
eukprot:GHVU01086264.1.p1 GENE.GHVU01086264.1~~GHVU01086264.1.p1  ORF type:complete len:784 (-),score=129.12 GHVU01086264.1:555-2906(-)